MVEANLESVISGRENNLNIIRLFAAFMVLFSHAFILSGSNEPITLFYNETYGVFGLDIFFVMSGFLITQSYLRTHNPAHFIWSRALRIFPALFCVVTLTAFVLGPLVTTLPLDAYITNPRTYSYLLTLTLYIGPNSLPGVFPHNPFAFAVNGSLWMLKYMVAFYALVLFLGITKVLDKKRIILMMFLL
jgi:peptidoglycan/LPS O-acetylase OafA/YrhL